MAVYKHLSSEERTLIAHYKEQGVSVSEIARRVKRHKATISRELRRNTNKSSYRPDTAEKRYLARRKKLGKLDINADLRAYVCNLLYEGFSPQTISDRLKNYGDLEGIVRVSFESIYRWIYRAPQKKEGYYKLLVHAHAKRGRRKRVHRGKIQDRTSIHERPEDVMTRQEAGHWEVDLISFRGNTQHILVIHERKTRYTATVKLKTKTAAETMQGLLTFFRKLPRNLLKSVTFDNGLEFAYHKEIQDNLKVMTYFCDVYASWQKGGIENMNGRLRRDLPRKTDIERLSEADLEQIILSHNITPRRVLMGKSPLEALAKEQNRDIVFLFSRGVALQM